MGLTSSSTGFKTERDKKLKEQNKDKIVIALAGNPNVGKSSIFNELTGLKQHTGNWAGKTVANTCGSFTYKRQEFILADIPGTYSLYSHSKEEEVARDFICFSGCQGAIVVCDATCLERNLNLVLQVAELVPKTILCVNLIDEAEKKGIFVNKKMLENLLKMPVVMTSATKKIGLKELKEEIYKIIKEDKIAERKSFYTESINSAVRAVRNVVEPYVNSGINLDWLSLKLIEADERLLDSIFKNIGIDLFSKNEILDRVKEEREKLNKKYNKPVSDEIISQLIKKAEKIASLCVSYKKENYNLKQEKIDRILTGKYTAVPIMLLMLGFVFYLTIKGANYPSELLARLLFGLEDKLIFLLDYVNMPRGITEFLVYGVYKVVAWVISVMLPPMAIFFPLFTLLEDLGYLPRIAFNLDRCFKCCSACGKQSLTMAMGFGCNAAGVVGCRIIDSPRERLIAIITNSMVPCNGRFPTLIAIITMFFVGIGGKYSSVFSALILTGVILFSIFMTFFTSKLLSMTVLKGVPSNFTLELPPYRKPQLIKLIIRSVYDRTVFVLARAVLVAIPAGAIIFILANTSYNSVLLLYYISSFLDPFARLIGLDGIILMAFILGFPANEIVIPIMLMAYLSTGTLSDYSSLEELKQILVNNGWTWLTAVCTMLFSLMHWPCSTTLLTIKKETKNIKWTLISFFMPTIMGIVICFIVASVARLLCLV